MDNKQANQCKTDLYIVSPKGDTEEQAFLRDSMIKRRKTSRSTYVSKILLVLKPGMNVLDIGCGTAHVIKQLGANQKASEFLGLDVSEAMLKIAKKNCGEFSNISLICADGLDLPFPENRFDMVITRLAEYSPQEACRVLKRGGIFFEYGLGPKADKEIFEFFQERIETENFFFPNDPKEWKNEISEPIERAGFIVVNVQDYKEYEYYRNEEELMDLIEMVPLVKDFDRKGDRDLVKRLAEKYRKNAGIRITWHYYILLARRM